MLRLVDVIIGTKPPHSVVSKMQHSARRYIIGSILGRCRLGAAAALVVGVSFVMVLVVLWLSGSLVPFCFAVRRMQNGNRMARENGATSSRIRTEQLIIENHPSIIE